MEGAIDSTTSMTTPPEEVDNLIQMVADEAGLKVAGLMDNAGVVNRDQPQVARGEESRNADDFEARLAALRG